MATRSAPRTAKNRSRVDERFDWRRIARVVLVSRAIDELEETRLVPEKKVLYQFSARGHDVGQVMLGSLLNHPHDGVGAYYRSRPMLLTLGLSIEDAIASPMAKSGGFSDGRDIGVVCNLPVQDGPVVLPMSGDVGSQYTPTAGWAQAIVYHREVLGDASYTGSIGVVLGGDASVATNGFWAALTMATTLELPMLFYIEDNGYGISVTSNLQTPGSNIADNLASFRNLLVRDGDGTEPAVSAKLLHEVVAHVRAGNGPALVRLTVPRLSGHSGQDTQAYKTPEILEAERARDPLPALERYLVPGLMTAEEWQALQQDVRAEVESALEGALARPFPDPAAVRRYVFTERQEDGSVDLQRVGGVWPSGQEYPATSAEPEATEPRRLNLEEAVRRTLASELRANPKALVFGEDVGAKGGVHGVTKGLMTEFGEARVFDTSLSEEGIIGRAVGMALAGLMPVAEIQFRKYADPATEQLNNCGTMRWRTANRFAAPIVVRMPGGFGKFVGDPWHSVTGEVTWAHAVGWQVAIPSNAEDAVGLLRTALRGNDPVIFFEHRYLGDSSWARRPYPGDRYAIPFGKARRILEGTELTIVTWGAMVERCELAAQASGRSIEVLDLRTIAPWDREAVLESVQKTNRCLIVHEDLLTAGFGAEVAAVVAKEAFFWLDAPVERVAIEDTPTPYNPGLSAAVVPSVERISAAIASVLGA
jgi:2-oxoisovalerate dehydrogenase E1 component